MKDKKQIEQEYIDSYDKGNGCLIVLIYFATLIVMGAVIYSIALIFQK